MAKRKRKKEQNAPPPEPNPSANVNQPPRAVSPYLSYLIGFGIVILTVAAVGGVAFMKSQQTPQTTPAEPAPAPVPTRDNTPLRDFKVVNAHDHLMARKFLDKYLSAAQQTGVVKTLFVASSDYTLKGSKFEQTAGNDENTEAILAAAREFPDKIVPYCTIHPGDPDKLDKIRKYVAEGAKGVKLYTGHGNFYDRPLDAPDMLPFYAYCEETRLPICWHVNIVKYAAEFERVMTKFPRLIVIVPHFGVTFFRPREAPFREFQRLMDAYPYLYTDTCFGTRNILIDGLEAVSRDPQPFRDFIAKYSDRVLFGTDMVITGNKEKSDKWIADVIRACRQLLERDSYSFYMGAKGSPYASKNSQNEKGVFRGLALDDATLRKIYETNFDHLTALSQPPPKS